MPCQKCQKHVTYKSGIICANFGYTRGTFSPCKGAWCAECFPPHYLDQFETAVPRDFNGVTLAEVEDKVRFNKVRPSDHICCPFQCPNCQSQNICDRDLIRGQPSDDAFECLVIRATIDAFWSHASKTISSHRSEVKFVCKYAEPWTLLSLSLV